MSALPSILLNPEVMAMLKNATAPGASPLVPGVTPSQVLGYQPAMSGMTTPSAPMQFDPQTAMNQEAIQRDDAYHQSDQATQDAADVKVHHPRGPNTGEIAGAIAMLLLSGKNAGEVGHGLMEGYLRGHGEQEGLAQEQAQQERQASLARAQAFKDKGLQYEQGRREKREEYLSGIQTNEAKAAQDRLFEQQGHLHEMDNQAASDKAVTAALAKEHAQQMAQSTGLEKDLLKDWLSATPEQRGMLAKRLIDLKPDVYGKLGTDGMQAAIDAMTPDQMAKLASANKSDAEAGLATAKTDTENQTRPGKVRLLSSTADEKDANAKFRKTAETYIGKDYAIRLNNSNWARDEALKRLEIQGQKVDKGEAFTLKDVANATKDVGDIQADINAYQSAIFKGNADLAEESAKGSSADPKRVAAIQDALSQATTAQANVRGKYKAAQDLVDTMKQSIAASAKSQKPATPTTRIPTAAEYRNAIKIATAKGRSDLADGLKAEAAANKVKL